MSKLSKAKIFGGMGAVLSLVGSFIPFIEIMYLELGVILFIAGWVLVVIAIKYIADETKHGPIFKNYLVYFVCSILAIVATAVILIIGCGLPVFFLVGYMGGGSIDPDFIIALIGALIMAIVVTWILMIIGTIYLRKSYNSIAKYTKVDLFRTTGTVYFIGAITLIVLVGALILLIAKILEIVSFFSLPDKIPIAAEASKESEVIT